MFAGGIFAGAMSEHDAAPPPSLPRLCHYLAVPTDDNGLSQAARSCYTNLQWSTECAAATHKNWQAYQNLLQLVGILTTANIGNAKQVWEHVVEFVDDIDTAQYDMPATKKQKTSLTTAAEVLKTSEAPVQSSSPVDSSTKAEPFAGPSTAFGAQHFHLTAEQKARIKQKREEALAIRAAKQQQNETAQHAAGSTVALPQPGLPSCSKSRSCVEYIY